MNPETNRVEKKGPTESAEDFMKRSQKELMPANNDSKIESQLETVGDVPNELSEEELAQYQEVKENLRSILAKAGIAGLITVLFGLVSCQLPLPAVVAILTFAEEACEQHPEIVTATALLTIAAEFGVGFIGYIAVRTALNKITKLRLKGKSTKD